MSRILPVFLLFVIWISCDSLEDSVSFDPSLEIQFSNDSVAFDTLLSGTRSATHRLTVYNRNESSVQISEILLGKRENSDYSIIINGKEGTSQLNEPIRGGDSLLILVEVNVDPQNQNQPYLVKDSIIFNWNENTEHVKLVSWAQDARPVGSRIVCNETWTSERPYFVDGIVSVESGCTLTIQQGTKLFFNNGALLLIEGTLIANGDSANNILFTNSRFDSGFDRVPGQWNGLIFLEESTNNELTFCTIENAEIAIGTGYQLQTTDGSTSLIPGEVGNGLRTELTLANTTIRNASTAGLLSFNSEISATNCLIYNCGTYLVGNFIGGTYQYEHCTFSNEPGIFINEEPTVQFSDNIVIGANDLLTDNLNVELTNSIIWGSGDEELLINNGGGALLNAILTTNIIRSGEEIEGNFTSREFNFPGFKSSFTFDYSLDTLAFAKDKGTDLGLQKDIIGANRDNMPDIGAFERIEEE